jgi:hypothetical protein
MRTSMVFSFVACRWPRWLRFALGISALPLAALLIGYNAMKRAASRDSECLCWVSSDRFAMVAQCLLYPGGFNRSTQHSSLPIWHVETVCIWRGVHGHGPRGSRRPSSRSAGEGPMDGGRLPSVRGTRAASKIITLNGEIGPASSVASTG